MATFPFKPKQLTPRNYKRLCAPLCLALTNIPKLAARGDRPLQMDFEDLLHILIFFHLQEHA
ncbi:MAG: IS4 family transposase, partial [Desulfobulbus sp.]|nr:IS4 family transposase [Desulfobulbus sp.]